jgi:hypothetical protein
MLSNSYICAGLRPGTENIISIQRNTYEERQEEAEETNLNGLKRNE